MVKLPTDADREKEKANYLAALEPMLGDQPGVMKNLGYAFEVGWFRALSTVYNNNKNAVLFAVENKS